MGNVPPMRPPSFRPIQDKTIVNVLHHIRSSILRDGLEGLEHVDALLGLRGVDPASLYTPRKWPNHFRRGELRRAVAEALTDGPLTLAVLAARVGGGLAPQDAYRRTYKALQKMQDKGIVWHEGRLWGLRAAAPLQAGPSRWTLRPSEAAGAPRILLSRGLPTRSG